MAGTDLPTQEISDEVLTAFFEGQDQWKREHGDIGSQEDARNYFRAGLAAALVASSYRREVDVLREAAPGLVDRAADAARRMAGDDSNSAAIMASIVTGAVWQALRCTCSDHTDEGAVYIEDLTCPMHGSIPATALEQAQPLLADGSEVESLELVESPEGQERSEGDEPCPSQNCHDECDATCMAQLRNEERRG